jgi:dolichol-phosphate mannosyltransferase
MSLLFVDTPEHRPRALACVVLPTFNERDNIEVVVRSIFAAMSGHPTHRIVVLVVDDASPDGTGDVVRRLKATFSDLHLLVGRKLGLGDAYKRGFAHAMREWAPDLVIQMDADGQHDPSVLPLFVDLANHGFSVVIGSRFVAGASTPDFALSRLLISRTGNFLVRMIGGIARIHDCTSGFRCISTKLLPQCNFEFLSTRGYSFQSALICELIRNGGRVIEVPIAFGERRSGQSKLSFRDQWEFVVGLVKLRFRNSGELMRYGLVGLSGTLVNFAVYLPLTRLANVTPELAAPLAIEIAILSNFILHTLWTFSARPQRTTILARISRFHFVAALGGAANYLTFLGLLRLASINDVVSNLLGIAVGAVVNYVLNANWTWRRSS